MSLAIFVREFFGVRSASREAFNKLRAKVSSEGRTDGEISKPEATFLNFYLYRIFSTSKTYFIAELAQRGEVGDEWRKKDVVLKHMPTLMKLLGAENGVDSHKNHRDRSRTSWEEGVAVGNPLTLEMQSFHVEKDVRVPVDVEGQGQGGDTGAMEVAVNGDELKVGDDFIDTEKGEGESRDNKGRPGSFRLSTWDLPDSDDEDHRDMTD